MHITFKLPKLSSRCVRLLLCLPFSLAQAGELNLSYGLGVRDDGLRWAIAYPIGPSPNIYSELTWRNLKGWEHNFGLEYIASSGWMGRANLRLAGFNIGGEVQDSDYTLDNRNGENYRSLNATHGSTAQDATLLIGHRLYTNESKALAITPVIGLSRNVTDLRMNNGVQVIGAPLGPYPNLDSRYRAQFSSMLAGAEARWWLAPPFGLDLKWHHHWFNYHAEADWNLRTDLQHPASFYQNGHGIDNRWKLGLLARLNKDWAMELAYSKRIGSFQNGLHVTNNSDGTQQGTLLREVEWSSASTSLVAQRTF